ncbi:hypothetical protein EYF80_057383 [Liparis tanakae]|uniref:Uncharacterized protein n=1 Tax=Liparis tanakae TaxID=230148 RepID=A0A4Z2EU53_9TELE|nr:hypothetical protein EYF80_057383 [Liparis tanakae]
MRVPPFGIKHGSGAQRHTPPPPPPPPPRLHLHLHLHHASTTHTQPTPVPPVIRGLGTVELESEKEAAMRLLAPWMLRLMICPFSSSFCSFRLRLSWRSERETRYLFESSDLLLQLGLAGPGVVLLQPGARRAPPLGLGLQLVELQVLQLLTQVLDELREARGPNISQDKDVDEAPPTSCVHSFSFWLWWRSWLSLSAIFLRDSVSSCSRSAMSSLPLLLDERSHHDKHRSVERSVKTGKERNDGGRTSRRTAARSMFARRHGTHDLSSPLSSSSCCSLGDKRIHVRHHDLRAAHAQWQVLQLQPPLPLQLDERLLVSPRLLLQLLVGLQLRLLQLLLQGVGAVHQVQVLLAQPRVLLARRLRLLLQLRHAALQEQHLGERARRPSEWDERSTIAHSRRPRVRLSALLKRSLRGLLTDDLLTDDLLTDDLLTDDLLTDDLLTDDLTLSVMSLSASCRMSRVKSLMVSSVIELFWRRFLKPEKQTSSLEPVHVETTDSVIMSFNDRSRNIKWLTGRLSYWTASCLSWRGQHNGTKVRRRRGPREETPSPGIRPPALFLGQRGRVSLFY